MKMVKRLVERDDSMSAETIRDIIVSWGVTDADRNAVSSIGLWHSGYAAVGSRIWRSIGMAHRAIRENEQIVVARNAVSRGRL